MGVVSKLPASWRMDVTVLRGGGRDAKGNPITPTEITRKGVLLAPRATSDPVDRSDVTDNTAVLYDDDAAFRYQPTDRIRVPDGVRMAGTWAVDGRPGEWPEGSEVGLVRA